MFVCVCARVCMFVCANAFVCVCVCTEERNSLGVDRLFVHNHHKLYPVLKTLYEDNRNVTVSAVCPIGHRLNCNVV